MKKTTLGTASLTCGIISLVLFVMPYFGLPLAIFAVVFGTKQKKLLESGIATAGQILGIIGIVINSITGLILAFVMLVPILFGWS